MLILMVVWAVVAILGLLFMHGAAIVSDSVPCDPLELIHRPSREGSQGGVE
jgi:hypothetical protein